MPRRPVKRRTYRSPAREAGAQATRRAILDAAHDLFVAHGYDAMTMQAVAERAGVAVDTIYETIGKKPVLTRLLVEATISRTDQAVPAEEREYVLRIQAASDAREKLAIYAAAVVAIHRRLAPLARALQMAAPRHPELGALWHEISERRANNMRKLAANLVATGSTRPDLDLQRIADVLWTFTAPELFLLFVEQRGWTVAEVEAWLADAWARLILA